MEYYSRLNCLVVHGVPESKEDTGEAVLEVFNERLNVRVTPQCHRMGRQQPSTDKPRPVIVKFVSYEMRRQVFSAKRPQRMQGRHNGKFDEAKKRDAKPHANAARCQMCVDDRWTDCLPP